MMRKRANKLYYKKRAKRFPGLFQIQKRENISKFASSQTNNSTATSAGTTRSYPACQRYENPASRTFFVSTRCLPYPLDNWCCEDCSAVRSVRFVCIAFIPLRTLQETTVPSIKMDSSDKPAMSTALIGTAVLVVLFTTLVLQIKPVHRAVTASFSRLRLLIMTNVHIPERRPRSRSRSLSNQSLVQVSHLFIHPGKLLQYIQCRLFCHVKLVVVFYDVFYGNFTRHH
jgi:hypothetical protein